MMNEENRRIGKQNRAMGAKFERKVKKELEDDNWIVEKWGNNVDLEFGGIIRAKPKWFKGKPIGLGSGFPDFLALKKLASGNWDVMFVECKSNGKMLKDEKDKMRILEDKGFNCFVAHNEYGQTSFRKSMEYTRTDKLCREKAGD